MNIELQRIKSHYDDRNVRTRKKKHGEDREYVWHCRAEREHRYARILDNLGQAPETMRVLEIGAGNGDNLLFFSRYGVRWENLAANEFLPDRVATLASRFPQMSLHEGDATDYPTDRQFDVIFQSLVFTLLREPETKIRLADHLWSLIRPGGLFLWYDLAFDNPKNPHVHGQKRRAVRDLFPRAERIEFQRVSLAPPIARRVKRFYHWFNWCVPLRSHLIAAIHKPAA